MVDIGIPKQTISLKTQLSLCLLKGETGFYIQFPNSGAPTPQRINMASNQATAEVPKVAPKPTLTPFAGKVIAVTGASRGVGLALTRYLIERGATVSMCSATAKNLTAAHEGILKDFPEAKDRVMTTVVDIGKWDMVEAWIKATVERFGPLHGAANVAGMCLSLSARHVCACLGDLGMAHSLPLPAAVANHRVFPWLGVEQSRIRPLAMLEPEYFTEIMHVNVTGTFHCLREEMKNMRDGGSIVNVGSVAGTYGGAGAGAYTAAKHALMGLTKTAAFEGASRRIRVNIVNP